MFKPSSHVSMDGRFVVDTFGDPKNHPIVFLCGWGMSTNVYHDRLMDLAENFYVYSISLPGFGKAVPMKLRESSVRGHANMIKSALLELSLDGPVTLMGHSTGGGVAVLIAESSPHLVSEVILITPVGSRDPLLGSLKRIIFDTVKREGLSIKTDEGLFKHLFHNLKLAFDAKKLNLSREIENLVLDGVPVHMFLSESDMIAPPGKLAHVTGANIYWVDGGHMWLKNYADDFITMCNAILQHNIKAPAAERWVTRKLRQLKRFFYKMFRA